MCEEAGCPVRRLWIRFIPRLGSTFPTNTSASAALSSRKKNRLHPPNLSSRNTLLCQAVLPTKHLTTSFLSPSSLLITMRVRGLTTGPQSGVVPEQAADQITFKTRVQNDVNIIFCICSFTVSGHFIQSEERELSFLTAW